MLIIETKGCGKMTRLNFYYCLYRLMVLGLITIAGVTPARAFYQVGDSVSNFSLINWNGDTLSLYDYSGKFIFLNFWYTTG